MSAYEFIKTDSYNTLIDNLNAIRDFGEKDTSNSRTPDTSSLTKKNPTDLITFEEYQELFNLINSNLVNFNKYDIILETYFQDLKAAFNNYKISNTRGYTTYCCDHCDHCSDCAYSCSEHWCYCNHYGPCGAD